MHFIFGFLLSVISVFLILLVLVQRGRGGGLTGALGGMGGQSAFGTKAGDTFTRITIVTATVWIFCAILSIKFLGSKAGPLGNADAAAPPVTLPAGSGAEPGGTGLGPLDTLPTAPAGSGAANTPNSGATSAPSGDAPPSSNAEADTNAEVDPN